MNSKFSSWSTHDLKMAAEVGSADIYFAKKLANNDKKIRDKSVKRLREWIATKVKADGLDLTSMLRLWKGLFYCMWFSDKPLVQEEMADKIANILHLFTPPSLSGIMFSKVFFITMGREWHDIDRLRLDKFYMLIKKYIAATYQYLGNCEWEESLVKAASSFFTEALTNENYPDGLKIIFAEYALDEFTSSCEKAITLPDNSTLLTLVEPFFSTIAFSNSESVQRMFHSNVLMRLLELNISKTQQNGNTVHLKMPLTLFAERLFEHASNKMVQTKNRKRLLNFRNKYMDYATEIEVKDASREKKKNMTRKKTACITEEEISLPVSEDANLRTTEDGSVNVEIDGETKLAVKKKKKKQKKKRKKINSTKTDMEEKNIGESKKMEHPTLHEVENDPEKSSKKENKEGIQVIRENKDEGAIQAVDENSDKFVQLVNANKDAKVIIPVVDEDKNEERTHIIKQNKDKEVIEVCNENNAEKVIQTLVENSNKNVIQVIDENKDKDVIQFIDENKDKEVIQVADENKEKHDQVIHILDEFKDQEVIECNNKNKDEEVIQVIDTDNDKECEDNEDIQIVSKREVAQILNNIDSTVCTNISIPNGICNESNNVDVIDVETMNNKDVYTQGEINSDVIVDPSSINEITEQSAITEYNKNMCDNLKIDGSEVSSLNKAAIQDDDIIFEVEAAETKVIDLTLEETASSDSSNEEILDVKHEPGVIDYTAADRLEGIAPEDVKLATSNVHTMKDMANNCIIEDITPDKAIDGLESIAAVSVSDASGDDDTHGVTVRIDTTKMNVSSENKETSDIIVEGNRALNFEGMYISNECEANVASDEFTNNEDSTMLTYCEVTTNSIDSKTKVPKVDSTNNGNVTVLTGSAGKKKKKRKSSLTSGLVDKNTIGETPIKKKKKSMLLAKKNAHVDSVSVADDSVDVHKFNNDACEETPINKKKKKRRSKLLDENKSLYVVDESGNEKLSGDVCESMFTDIIIKDNTEVEYLKEDYENSTSLTSNSDYSENDVDDNINENCNGTVNNKVKKKRNSKSLSQKSEKILDLIRNIENQKNGGDDCGVLEPEWKTAGDDKCAGINNEKTGKIHKSGKKKRRKSKLHVINNDVTSNDENNSDRNTTSSSIESKDNEMNALNSVDNLFAPLMFDNKKKRKDKVFSKDEDEPKPVASFLKTLPPAAAFFKKSLMKTEPKKKLIKNELLSTPRTKRVRIELDNNQSVHFKDLKVSPMPAFCPTRKPIKSAIKSPKASRRASASDFF